MLDVEIRPPANCLNIRSSLRFRNRSQPVRVRAGFQVLKAHKLARPFIPEFKLPASKTLPQGDRWRPGKRRVSILPVNHCSIFGSR
jgi:hypothetical protein